MVQMAQRAYSEAQYFDLERDSVIKHEYYAGSIYAMAGGSPDHNRIGRNILSALTVALRGTPCEPFGSDQRVRTPAGLLTYPDVSVFCGRMEFAPGERGTATNPTALFEVLSDSTQAYDRGEKFNFYHAIPTLRDYVLIDQSTVHVEVRSRDAAGEWHAVIYTTPTEDFEVASLRFRMAIREVYEQVEFNTDTGQ